MSKSYFDFALSTNGNEGAALLSWNQLHGLGKKKQKLKVGYGIRFTSYVGGNRFYTTAPAKYTGSDLNIDTITTNAAQVNSLNLSLHIQYTVLKKLDLGFNIDAIGFSFGTKKDFNILSSVYDQGQIPVQEARPTTFNLLLVGDNDLGTLNSEFFLRYWVSEKVGIKGGFNFLFTEYTTNQNLSFDNARIQNDRYRNKSGMFLLGMTVKPF